MSNKIYIFDIDGTLTPSRRKMDKEFQKFFMKWAEDHPFYLVTGSDLKKTVEQLPEEVILKAEGTFCCCGNVFYKRNSGNCWATKYRRLFKPPEDLYPYLESVLKKSKYHHRAGKHIENRETMLNFSVVGRNCSVMERENYFKWDEEHGERENIVNFIVEEWPELDASRGGQISIDIYPKGRDKSQIIDHIPAPLNSKFIFFGDRTTEGGNDYPLAKLIHGLNKHSFRLSGEVHQVDGWEDTLNHLKEKVND